MDQVISGVGSKMDQHAATRSWQAPAYAGLTASQVELVLRSAPGGWQNVQDIYPLSPLQEGFLFHHVLNEQFDTYAIPTLFELRSHEEVGALVQALQRVIDRHDVLRTAILWERLPHPVQVVYRAAVLPVESLTLSADRDPVEQLRQQMRPQLRRLDMRRAPLAWLEVAANPRGEQWYAILWVHHIICDHQSQKAVVQEASEILEGRGEQLPCPAPFRDYVLEAIERARTDDATAYCLAKFQDVDDTTAPFGLLDVHGDGSRIEELQCEVNRALAQRLRIQARQLGVSAARLIHAAWSLVVAHTSGRDDIVFGTVVSIFRQQSPTVPCMLGMFLNTLPLRLRLVDVTARDFVKQTHAELTEVLRYSQASLAVAQQSCALDAKQPLFTALLNYRHSSRNPEGAPVGRSGVRALERGETWTNYPVSMAVDDLGEGFALLAKVDRRIGAERIVDYMQTALHSLVHALEQAPDTPVLALRMLPVAEHHRVIDVLNATQTRFPHDVLIHEAFEKQAANQPEAIALIYEEQSLTYEQLNARANQLAHYLRSKAVGPDTLVGICVDRSLEMVVAMLGVLKAGGAYVPLDPDYPAERLQYMLKDAAPAVVLIQGRMRERLLPTRSEIVALDEDWAELATRSAENPDPKTLGLRAGHLAYVIYTSGSTGQPKGVMVEHRNVMSLWQGLERLYSLAGPCARVAVNASFTFDASVKQFVQLLSGRTIVLIPQEARWDAASLLQVLDRQRVDSIDCTPWQLKSWLTAGLLDAVGGPRLRVVLVGGEPIDGDLWRTLSRAAATEFFNVYGPTESTVDTTFARLRDDSTAPHIGQPMENRRVYVMNRLGQPMPVGVPGEIYIGGAGIARGYLNRPELTAARFLPDPFAGDPLARMYRTGDVGRWRSDGAVEYLGRNDRQVKFRGFRIELGEIEAQLSLHGQVTEAVASIFRDDGGVERLVAYVVARDVRSPPTALTLRAHLRPVLPDYMVPSSFVLLDQVPLTPNGKLDRSALPAPASEQSPHGEDESPQGELEEAIATIWREVLQVDRIARDGNFFELGGHSLLAMQVVARMRALLGIDLPMRTLFEAPTVRQLAAHAEQRRSVAVDTSADEEMHRLVAEVAAMQDSRVQQLLAELTAEGRL